MNEEEIGVLVIQSLNIGEAMYCAGAEISRIESTLRRLCKSYGAEHVNVYAITSSIVVTVEFPGKAAITQSRRIRRRDALNLIRLERLNQISRDCEKKPLPIEELRRRVLTVLSEQPKQLKLFVGNMIAAAAFTVFFGGDLCDALIGCAAGAFVWGVQKVLQPMFQSRIYFHVLVSFLTGFLIAVSGIVWPMRHPDKIMIGTIMVLIPGVALTNSIRYTLSGDSISGIEKLIDSILQAFAIAIGFSLAALAAGRI